jgi:phenylpropionate dioxygenase-like ring-hydroxylating dioxygenase large terminal subunit
MMTGTGNSKYLSCPYHRWSYEHDTGKCVNSPFCKNDKVDASLNRSKINHWKNLLFNNEGDFGNDVKRFHLLEQMQIDKMVYKKTVTEKLDYNWKHYIDVFGENYHIPFIHPGFNFYLDLNTMDWFEENEFHGQMVKPRSIEYLKNHKTTPVYSRWIDLLLEYYNNQLPEYAGLLLMYYPNIMIECYPLYMTISTIHPTGPESSIMHCDYFHHEDVITARPDIVEAAEAASAETMLEDADICIRTAEGRKFLYEEGREEQGPYQTPFENGLAMFHSYYHRMIGVNDPVLV